MCLRVLSSLSQHYLFAGWGFDIHDRIKVHKWFGYSIAFFTLVHVGAHFANYYYVSILSSENDDLKLRHFPIWLLYPTISSSYSSLRQLELDGSHFLRF
jgi:hypothetical protein